jgi:hypothetical protein
MLRNGRWKIRCDCGWEHDISPHRGNTVLQGHEIADLLETAFVGHLSASERHLYILVDQRPDHVGNWIMPEGSPCLLISHFESDGIRIARFMPAEVECGEDGSVAKPKRGAEPGLLPVGEIRTADGKVFRANLAAMTNDPVADRSTG